MSDTVPSKTVKIHTLPFVIKKSAIKSCQNLDQNYDLLFQCIKNCSNNLLKEDIIYKASDRDIFNGKYPNLIITNRLNVLRNNSRTIATYEKDSRIVELTSDPVTKLIGQKNYDIVFSALCSVISQDLKIQGILSLLSLEKNIKKVNVDIARVDKSSQTDHTSRHIILRDKQRRHTKRKQVRSYAVQDDMLPEQQKKKIIIDPNKLIESDKIKQESEEKQHENVPEEDKTDQSAATSPNHLPELFLDEDSNLSATSVLTGYSCNIPGILENPNSILNNIDKHTKDDDELTAVKMIDGSFVMIRGKPDMFHMSSPEVLEGLSGQDRKKILLHQAYIDWKFCLQANEDGDLPIHWAVLNNDVELLKRQCIVLKSRHQSVDITSGGKLTALQLSLLNDYAKCTAVLLTYGADPLIPDEESRTPLHLAAEVGSENVQAIIDHCRANAREILKDDEGLWKDHFENKSDKDLADYLLYKMCVMCDNQGYTPLMLASRIGNYESVKLLIQAAPGSINMGMPNSGNTALYLAVSTACLDCHGGSDKTTVSSKFMDTIAALVENGADPSIDNNSGSNVNILLTEFSISQLSMLIANKLTSTKFFDGGKLKNFDSYMLIKDSEGNMNLRELRENKDEIVGKEAKQDPPKKVVIQPGDLKTAPVEQKSKTQAAKRKSIILEDVPVITNFVSVTRNRPLILKKPVQAKPKHNTVDAPKIIVTNAQTKNIVKKQNIVETTQLIKIDAQSLKPLTRIDVKAPIKFVKILPKIDPNSSSTESTSTSVISRKKRSKSTSSSNSAKKFKI